MRISFSAAAEPETISLESEERVNKEASLVVRRLGDDYIPGSRIVRP